LQWFVDSPGNQECRVSDDPIVCKNDDACVGFPLAGGVITGGDDEAVANMTCYKGGETVFENHQMCDVTSMCSISSSFSLPTLFQIARLLTCYLTDRHRLPSVAILSTTHAPFNSGPRRLSHSTVLWTNALQEHNRVTTPTPPHTTVRRSNANVFQAGLFAVRMAVSVGILYPNTWCI